MEVTNYDTALKWLEGAKGQTPELTKDRSLYDWGGRIRLKKDPHSNLLIVYVQGSYQAGGFLIYRPDNSYIIPETYKHRAGQSFNRLIGKFTGNVINICIRKGKIVVVTAKDGKTDSKLKNCRTCKGVGFIEYTCTGPSSSWDVIRKIEDTQHSCISNECSVYKQFIDESDKAREEYWDAMRIKAPEDVITALSNKMMLTAEAVNTNIALFEHPAHITCDHGYTANQFQNVGWRERARLEHLRGDTYKCYRCSGTGKVDYGQKQTGHIWNCTEFLHIANDGTYLSGI